MAKMWLRNPSEYGGAEIAVTTGWSDTSVYMSDYAPAPRPLVSRTCPNCGAPVSGYKCEYCDSVFDGPYTLHMDAITDFDSLPMMAASACTILPAPRTVRRFDPTMHTWVWTSE